MMSNNHPYFYLDIIYLNLRVIINKLRDDFYYSIWKKNQISNDSLCQWYIYRVCRETIEYGLIQGRFIYKGITCK